MIASSQVNPDRLPTSYKGILSWFLCLLGSLLGCSTSKHAILATPKGFFTVHPSLHHLFPFLFSFLDSAGPVQQMSQGNKQKMSVSLYCRPSQSLQVIILELPHSFFPLYLQGGKILISSLHRGGQTIASPPKHGTPKADHSSQSFPSMNPLCGGWTGFLVLY